MLTTERAAMLQLLTTVGTTVNSSGFAVFFRSGSSNNIPKSLADLIASSRASVEYKYQQNTTDANGQYNYLFQRIRSMLPIAGYGASRVVPLDGQQKNLYAVYPEYTRFIAAAPAQNKTPQQVLAQCAAAHDVGGWINPAWSVGDIVEYDFGRTLRFRQIWSSTAVAATYFDIMSQDVSTGVWSKVPVTALGLTQGLDFSARRVRLVCKTATSEAVNYNFFAERGAEFVEAPLTHAVLVPLTIGVPNGANAFLNQVEDDYLGLVMDLGTDFTVNVSKTGKFGTVFGPELNIKLIDNFIGSV